MASSKIIFVGSLLLVVIAIWIAWVSYKDCGGLFRRYYHTKILKEKDFVAADVRFKERGAGTLVLPNGRLGDFTTVRASDCVEVTVVDEDEGSPAQAADEMEKRIRGASRVIEQRPVQYGEHNGERVIVLAPGDKEAEIIVRYENQRRLVVIGSASLAHALAYEKLIQHGYRHDRDGYVIDVTEPYRPGTR